jgi:hypothetical protein
LQKAIAILNKVSAKSALLQALVLLAVLPIAPMTLAGPMLAEQPAETAGSEFLQFRPKTWGTLNIVGNQDEARPATENTADPAAFLYHSDDTLLRSDNDADDDAVSPHDIAVAMYYAIYDINSDIAGDLLASYRAIGRIREEIITAIKTPLSAIGVGNDPFTQLQAGVNGAGLDDNGDHYDDSIHRNDIDKIMMLIQRLFSLDFLPYYLFALGLYVLFALFRRFVRQAGRPGSLHQ